MTDTSFTFSEEIRVNACSDCLEFAYNGAGYMDAEVAERCRKAAEGLGPLTCTDYNDLQPHFSMTRCDVCLSPLGGDRYSMSTWLLES